MQVTLGLDDELVARARDFTGIEDMSALVGEALRRMIRHERAERLIRLGGSDPAATAAPRDRRRRR